MSGGCSGVDCIGRVKWATIVCGRRIGIREWKRGWLTVHDAEASMMRSLVVRNDDVMMSESVAGCHSSHANAGMHVGNALTPRGSLAMLSLIYR